MNAMQGIEVDGARPAVSRVTGLPHSYRLTAAERLILLVLASDSFDGERSARGYAALAQCTGLSQGVLTKSLRSLYEATEDRPALLSKTTTRGRNATEWRLHLEPVGTPDQIAPVGNSGEPVGIPDQFELIEPVGEPVGQPVGELVGNTDDTLPYPTLGMDHPQELGTDRASVATTTPHPPHRYDSNARTSLQRIIGERRLPFSVDELLAASYALGGGDPWAGYLLVKDATARPFADANDPRALLLSRLREAGLNDSALVARLRRRAAS